MTAFSLPTKNILTPPEILDPKLCETRTSLDQVYSCSPYVPGQKRPLPDRVFIQPSKKIKQPVSYMRYKPNYEMSKEELKKWRREQRMIRNRQSAAASRQKVRNRIIDLENQVQFLQHKYGAVVDRLKKYEPSFDESILLNQNKGVVSPSTSPYPISQDINTSSLTNVDCNDELRLVDESAAEELDKPLEYIDESNSFIHDGISDDEELEEFLSYAFSESQ